MAKDVERLVVELSADVSRLERGLKAGTAATDRQTRLMEKRMAEMSARTRSSVSDMGAGIRNTIASIALGAAIREVGLYADAWTRAGNMLRSGGLDAQQAGARLDELVQISLRSRSSLDATVTLFSRLKTSASELGVTEGQILRVVETVNKALATGGLTGGERASAVTQLAQGLGSGTLAGDELKAIRENSIVLAQAIADEFDTTIGGLKKLGAEGELTSVRVFKAIEVAQARVDAAYASTTATIADSFTNLRTRATEYIGKLDEATGASAAFAGLITDVANNLDAFADAAIVAATVVGGALAGRAMVAAFTSFTALQVQIAVTNAQLVAFEITSGLAAGSLGRMSAAGVVATGAMRGLSGSLAFVGGPVGLAIIALGAAIALVAVNSDKAAEDAKKLADRIADQAKAAGVASGAQAELSNEITATQRWAAALTGETDKLADAHWRAAAAAKAQAIEEARLRLQTSLTTLADARVAARGRVARERGYAAQTLASGARSGLGPNGQPLGDVYGQARARINASDEVGNVVAATANVVAETANLNSIMRNSLADYDRGGGSGGGSGGDDKKGSGGGKGASGPTPEELAATREMLSLQMALDRLNAQGRTYDAEQVQAQIDKINLTKQLKDAGVENAAAVASAQIDAVRLAEAAARGREYAAERAQFFTDAAKEALVAYNAELERQLQYEIELARLNGNSTLVLQLERRLQLMQAINALGPNATAAQKAVVAGREGALNDAEDRAILVDQGKEMARSFVDIIRADDIGTELGNRFRQAAFDRIEEVLGNLFSRLMQGGPQGGGGGGGWLQAGANALGSLFGGRRALGGPVRAGMAYQVNENTPNSEYFVPKADGWVGNIKAPRGGGQRAVTHVSVRNELYLAGANGDSVIYANVRRMLDQSQRQTVAAVKAGAPSAQLENTLLRE